MQSRHYDTVFRRLRLRLIFLFFFIYIFCVNANAQNSVSVFTGPAISIINPFAERNHTFKKASSHMFVAGISLRNQLSRPNRFLDIELAVSNFGMRYKYIFPVDSSWNQPKPLESHSIYYFPMISGSIFLQYKIQNIPCFVSHWGRCLLYN